MLYPDLSARMTFFLYSWSFHSLYLFPTLFPQVSAQLIFFYHTNFIWSLCFLAKTGVKQGMFMLSRGSNAKQIPQGKILMGEILLLPELIEKNVFRQAQKVKCSRFVQGWSSTKWLYVESNRTELKLLGMKQSSWAKELNLMTLQTFFLRKKIQNQERLLLESLLKATMNLIFKKNY